MPSLSEPPRTPSLPRSPTPGPSLAPPAPILRPPPAIALALGWAGLVPFVAAASLCAFGPTGWRGWAASSLAAYAAVIASFLGGIHWGLAFRQVPPLNTPALLWGVVPSLLAWPAMLMPRGAGLALLSASLLLCYAVDCWAYPKQGAAAWLGLRMRLTAVATLSCAAAAVLVW